MIIWLKIWNSIGIKMLTNWMKFSKLEKKKINIFSLFKTTLKKLFD